MVKIVQQQRAHCTFVSAFVSDLEMRRETSSNHVGTPLWWYTVHSDRQQHVLTAVRSHGAIRNCQTSCIQETIIIRYGTCSRPNHGLETWRQFHSKRVVIVATRAFCKSISTRNGTRPFCLNWVCTVLLKCASTSACGRGVRRAAECFSQQGAPASVLRAVTLSLRVAIASCGDLYSSAPDDVLMAILF